MLMALLRVSALYSILYSGLVAMLAEYIAYPKENAELYEVAISLTSAATIRQYQFGPALCVTGIQVAYKALFNVQCRTANMTYNMKIATYGPFGISSFVESSSHCLRVGRVGLVTLCIRARPRLRARRPKINHNPHLHWCEALAIRIPHGKRDVRTVAQLVGLPSGKRDAVQFGAIGLWAEMTGVRYDGLDSSAAVDEPDEEVAHVVTPYTCMGARELATAEGDVLEGLAGAEGERLCVWDEVALLGSELEGMRVIAEGKEAQTVAGLGVHDQHGELRVKTASG